MIVLGLDLSTKPGFAIIEDGQLRSYGTKFDLQRKIQPSVGFDPDYDLMDRALEIADALVCAFNLDEVDLISIEQSNQGSGLVAMKSQEFIHFAVLQRVRQAGHHAKVSYILSPTWQSLCGQRMTKEQRKHNKAVKAGLARGKIRKKHLSVQWANATFGLQLRMKDEDAADAIGIAYAGWKRRVEMSKIQKIDVDGLFISKEESSNVSQ